MQPDGDRANRTISGPTSTIWRLINDFLSRYSAVELGRLPQHPCLEGFDIANAITHLIAQLEKQRAARFGTPAFQRGFTDTRLTEVPFAGIEGVYQISDGERRAVVLIEILSKPVAVHVAPSSLLRASW